MQTKPKVGDPFKRPFKPSARKPEIRTKAAIRTVQQLENALLVGSVYIEDNKPEMHFDIYLSKKKSGAAELIGSIPYPFEKETVVQTSGSDSGECPALSKLKAGILGGFRQLLQQKRLLSGSWGVLPRPVTSWLIDHAQSCVDKEY